MTKTRVDGKCKNCGAYANGVDMEWYGLCMACANERKKSITLPSGKTIWWEYNGAGGRTFYSDEVGNGVVVWDTALVDKSTLECVLTWERRLREEEDEAD